jgi:lipopolysaccharide transport system permease protein
MLTVSSARVNLFLRLAQRDIESQFRGSMLGLGWVVLIPASLVAIYSFVFGRILNVEWVVPTGNRFDVPMIYFFGISLFAFFMEVVARATRILHDNATYVTKVVFPLEMLVWVIIASAMAKFLLNLAIVVLLITLFGSGARLGMVLFPIWLVALLMLTAGLGYALAAIGAYVRDLTHVLQAIGPVLVFMSPVFYALSQVPSAYRPLYYFNPLTLPLENGRSLFFPDQPSLWASFPAYLLAAVIVLWLGRALFARLRPGFVDVV